MDVKDFKLIWNKRHDEETNIELTENDVCILLGGYAFVVQNDGKHPGNVVFKKVMETKFSLKEVFRMFRLYCLSHKIYVIRVEGISHNYDFLQKLFPYSVFMRDIDYPDKNIYFVKL